MLAVQAGPDGAPPVAGDTRQPAKHLFYNGLFACAQHDLTNPRVCLIFPGSEGAGGRLGRGADRRQTQSPPFLFGVRSQRAFGAQPAAFPHSRLCLPASAGRVGVTKRIGRVSGMLAATGRFSSTGETDVPGRAGTGGFFVCLLNSVLLYHVQTRFPSFPQFCEELVNS